MKRETVACGSCSTSTLPERIGREVREEPRSNAIGLADPGKTPLFLHLIRTFASLRALRG